MIGSDQWSESVIPLQGAGKFSRILLYFILFFKVETEIADVIVRDITVPLAQNIQAEAQRFHAGKNGNFL